VTAADAVIACGINPGTLSEIALAVRAGKPVVLVRPDATAAAFFQSLGANETLRVAAGPEEAVAWLDERR
jgi:nucleoside 2-deoxyribosyltransferase